MEEGRVSSDNFAQKSGRGKARFQRAEDPPRGAAASTSSFFIGKENFLKPRRESLLSLGKENFNCLSICLHGQLLAVDTRQVRTSRYPGELHSVEPPEAHLPVGGATHEPLARGPTRGDNRIICLGSGRQTLIRVTLILNLLK